LCRIDDGTDIKGVYEGILDEWFGDCEED